MARFVLVVMLFVAGCGIFSDPDDVVLRPVDEPDLDAGMQADQQTSPDVADVVANDLGVDVSLPPESCGDGLLQPAETCDPMLPSTSPGACPSSCDDGLACTADALVGAAETCDAACAAMPIVECVSNDGCCPSDCGPAEDVDCDQSAVCGGGVVSGLELCDPGAADADPGRCPATADDCPAQTCRVTRVVGAPQNCNSVCAYVPIVACVSGDGCCPSVCDESNDDDCASLCGNDIIEPGEGCDGNCPSDCADADACTINTLSGSTATCDAACATTEITSCLDDDGCCPASCTSGDDNDCSPSCGNAVLDPGETCDPPSTCPTSCNDGNACTTDVLSGSAGNCNVACTNSAITSCGAVDGCCPSQCNGNNDADCSAACGNGVVEAPERCDGNCQQSCDDSNACTADVTTGTAALCSRECSNTPITLCLHADGCCPGGCNAINDNDCGAVCGNAITEPGELCDGNCPPSCNDGNACTIDIRAGSSAQCNVSCSYSTVSSCVGADGCCPTGCNATNDSDCSPSCGNGIVEGNEVCDGNCPTASSCQALSPCKKLSGTAAACSATCVDIVGCQTCDLTAGAQCACPDHNICSGVCQGGNGDGCHRACDPTAYCEAWLGPNAQCVLVDGRCVACETSCESWQICNGAQCATPVTCNLSPDPDGWCASKGSNVCQGDKCFDL